MAHKKPARIDPISVRLPAGGVDSHAHLDSSEFDNDRAAVIARAKEAGVSQIGNVFLSPEAYESGKKYFADFPQVFFLLGIHPCDGLSCTPDCLEKIAACFRNDDRIRAVGEIGLDFHWDDCPRELQMQAFSRQLEMAKQLARPVVIHCREAEEECLTLLEAGGFANYPLLWHCFGGDKSLTKRIIRNGWHISVPGPVTYPANSGLREAVTVIPDDRLLLETDCPYLSPVPWRGTRNEPAYTVFTGRALAEARGEAPDRLWEICGANARRFFVLGNPAA
ncbi:MAG: TatD family hydrolase [Desulfovibrio sp.]|nr:TatD family hydrolase [Desulfovibrio sp.]